MDKLASRIKDYEKEYLNDYGFEQVMVWARQKYIESLIRKINPKKVLEIGCGLDQLFNQVKDLPCIEQWSIIEPSSIFFNAAKDQFASDGRVDVLKGFAEDFVDDVRVKNFDLCICSGLLHEVESPLEIILAAKKSLSKSGVLHVNVPNATSFHRILAVEMGLISTPYQLSDRNLSLSQYHVFDSKSLKTLMNEAGLKEINAGGYLIKPFTHNQMQQISPILGEAVLEGLWSMGTKNPEFASEIYLNARVA